MHRGDEYMKPVIDLTKEYGIVLDGGGARGAGEWEETTKTKETRT